MGAAEKSYQHLLKSDTRGRLGRTLVGFQEKEFRLWEGSFNGESYTVAYQSVYDKWELRVGADEPIYFPTLEKAMREAESVAEYTYYTKGLHVDSEKASLIIDQMAADIADLLREIDALEEERYLEY